MRSPSSIYRQFVGIDDSTGRSVLGTRLRAFFHWVIDHGVVILLTATQVFILSPLNFAPTVFAVCGLVFLLLHFYTFIWLPLDNPIIRMADAFIWAYPSRRFYPKELSLLAQVIDGRKAAGDYPRVLVKVGNAMFKLGQKSFTEAELAQLIRALEGTSNESRKGSSASQI
jgi:hypothetical protein